MTRAFGPARAQDTLWEVPDDLRERIETILLEHTSPARTGPPRAD
jgi:hypothetical protein